MIVQCVGDRPIERCEARIVLQGICGNGLNSSAWRDSRKLIGLPSGRVTHYTEEQFLLLVSIAKLIRRRQRCKSQEELTIEKIMEMSRDPKTIDVVKSFLERIHGDGWAMGQDLRVALSIEGFEINELDIERLIPEINPAHWYQVDDVIARLKARDGGVYA